MTTLTNEEQELLKENVLENYLRNHKTSKETAELWVQHPYDLLDVKINGIPLIFLLMKNYNELNDTFVQEYTRNKHVNNMEKRFQIKYELKQILEKFESLSDKFGNGYESYLPGFFNESSRINPVTLFTSSQGSLEKPINHSDCFSKEGFIKRTIKTHLAYKNILNGTNEPKDYDISYMKAHINEVKGLKLVVKNIKGLNVLKHQLGDSSEEMKETLSLLMPSWAENIDSNTLLEQLEPFLIKDASHKNINDINHITSLLSDIEIASEEEQYNFQCMDKEVLEQLFPFIMIGLYQINYFHKSSHRTQNGTFLDNNTTKIFSYERIAKKYIESIQDINLFNKIEKISAMILNDNENEYSKEFQKNVKKEKARIEIQNVEQKNNMKTIKKVKRKIF
jgi:hypothetical protein